MFANNDEKKLDWMYKGPTALVNREDYLLGRTADKTLDQLNDEEKNKLTNQLLAPPKNHVEHECIPPSIRDYNKIVQSEQVDLQAKLQEDPLVLIKRQEDETRKQFLQNPVQLKKLQEAMQAQMKKKKKHKRDDSEIDRKLRKKLKLLNKTLKKKSGYRKLEIISDDNNDEAILDTILMHKFNSLKSKLSEDDLKNIVLGNFSENEDVESDQEEEKKYFRSLNLSKTKDSDRVNATDSSDSDQCKKNKKSRSPNHTRYKNQERINKNKKEYDNIRIKHDKKKKTEKKRLTEEEKEAIRRNMMQQAAERNRDSATSYSKYKKVQSEPEKITHNGEEFLRREFLKSANSSSVSDRIKANVNNIQRTKSAMESNFLTK